MLCYANLDLKTDRKTQGDLYALVGLETALLGLLGLGSLGSGHLGLELGNGRAVKLVLDELGREGVNGASLEDDPAVLENVVGDDVLGGDDLDVLRVADGTPELLNLVLGLVGAVDEENGQVVAGTEALHEETLRLLLLGGLGNGSRIATVLDGCGCLLDSRDRADLLGGKGEVAIAEGTQSGVGTGPFALVEVADDAEETGGELGRQSGTHTEVADLAGQVLGPVTVVQRKDGRTTTTSTRRSVTGTRPTSTLLRQELAARVGDSRTSLGALVTGTKGREVPDNVAVENVTANGLAKDFRREEDGLARADGRGRGERSERRQWVLDGLERVGRLPVQDLLTWLLADFLNKNSPADSPPRVSSDSDTSFLEPARSSNTRLGGMAGDSVDLLDSAAAADEAARAGATAARRLGPASAARARGRAGARSA